MRRGLIVACLALCAWGANWAVAAAEKPMGEMTMEELLDSYPSGYGTAEMRKITLIGAEMLRRGEATTTFMETLFTAEAAGPKLGAYRQRILGLLAKAGPSSWGGADNAQPCIDALPEAERPAAAAYLDRLCKTVRPGIFEKALRNPFVPAAGQPPDGQFEWVLEVVRDRGDLRLADAMREASKSKEAMKGAYDYLCLMKLAAGQRDLMRDVMAKPDAHSVPEVGFQYAIKSGDVKRASELALAAIPEKLEKGLPWSVAFTLPCINTPEARQAVIRLYGGPRTPKDTISKMQSHIPDFLPEERLLALSDRDDVYFVRLLTQHKSDAAKTQARRLLGNDNFRSTGLAYLMTWGDADALRQALEMLNGAKDVEARRAIYALGKGGQWDKLPANLLERLKDDGERRQLLECAEANPVPACVPGVRQMTADAALALRAWTLLLRLGQPDAAAQVESRVAGAWALARAPALAALYRAGRKERLDGLVEIAQGDGLPWQARVEATRALGGSPADLKARASKTLLALLLSPYGDISAAANESLHELYPKADVDFAPWAEDAVRKQQAANWTDHAFPK